METNSKVKLMCSYGGKIHPRPHDHRLVYVGGDTKIISIDRHVSFSDIIAKLTSLTQTPNFSLKYQLPGHDLDALVSVINDHDLVNMMVEYDAMQTITPRRLRLFLFTVSKPDPKTTTFNPDFLFGFDKEYNYGAVSDPGMSRPEFADKQNLEISEREKMVVIPRENHLTVTNGYSVGPPVYLVPVTTGGVRFVYPEQPVYSYVAPVLATVAAKSTT